MTTYIQLLTLTPEGREKVLRETPRAFSGPRME